MENLWLNTHSHFFSTLGPVRRLCISCCPRQQKLPWPQLRAAQTNRYKHKYVCGMDNRTIEKKKIRFPLGPVSSLAMDYKRLLTSCAEHCLIGYQDSGVCHISMIFMSGGCSLIVIDFAIKKNFNKYVKWKKRVYWGKWRNHQVTLYRIMAEIPQSLEPWCSTQSTGRLKMASEPRVLW